MSETVTVRVGRAEISVPAEDVAQHIIASLTGQGPVSTGEILERVQELNIAKLAARFPDGFSDWNANNRDTVAEYVAMKEA